MEIFGKPATFNILIAYLLLLGTVVIKGTPTEEKSRKQALNCEDQNVVAGKMQDPDTQNDPNLICVESSDFNSNNEKANAPGKPNQDNNGKLLEDTAEDDDDEDENEPEKRVRRWWGSSSRSSSGGGSSSRSSSTRRTSWFSRRRTVTASARRRSWFSRRRTSTASARRRSWFSRRRTATASTRRRSWFSRRRTTKLKVKGAAITPKAKGRAVVKDVVNKVEKALGGTNNLLMRTAVVESNNGKNPNTYRKNYYGGIFQVDKTGFKDTQDVKSHPRLKKHFKTIKKEFGIDWSKVKWQDLKKPLYSGIAARLVYLNKPGAIPKDLKGQAEYWKKHYNSNHPNAAGSPKKFIERVKAEEKAKKG